tara:strand:+ start:1155 stop:1424 length:270 start_codon:yes stop_codon:yes gene_type:complete
MNKRDLQNFHDKVDPNIGNAKSLLQKLEEQLKGQVYDDGKRIGKEYKTAILLTDEIENHFAWIDRLRECLLRIEKYQDQFTNQINENIK